MENRLSDFLKNQGSNLNCKQFKKEMRDFIEKISDDDGFKKEILFHKALSHKTRMLIYKLIQKETTCNCALASLLELSEGSITHHIRILEKAGLITGRSKGHFIYYYTIENLKNILN